MELERIAIKVWQTTGIIAGTAVLFVGSFVVWWFALLVVVVPRY